MHGLKIYLYFYIIYLIIKKGNNFYGQLGYVDKKSEVPLNVYRPVNNLHSNDKFYLNFIQQKVKLLNI